MKEEDVWSEERIEVSREALRAFLKMVEYERVTEGAQPIEAYSKLVPVTLRLYKESARLMLTGSSTEELLNELVSVMEDPNK